MAYSSTYLDNQEKKVALSKAQKELADMLSPKTFGQEFNAPPAPSPQELQTFQEAMRTYAKKKAIQPTPDQVDTNASLGIAPAPAIPEPTPPVDKRVAFAKGLGIDPTQLDIPVSQAANLEKLQQANYYGGRNAATMAPRNGSTMTAAWETATPQQRLLAEQLAKGNVIPQDIGFRDRGAIVSLAAQYAKDNGIPFRSYEGSVRKGSAQYFAYGKGGQNATSINTALDHISSLTSAFDALDNTDVNILNTPINILRQKGNDPNIIAVDTALTAVRGELANVFKQSGATDQEIGHWVQVLNSDLTPDQVKSAIQEVEKLLSGRIGALEYQQSNTMNTPSSGRTLISPQAHAVRQNIKSDVQTQPPQQPDSTQTSNTQTAKPATASPKIGEIRSGKGNKRYRYKGGAVNDPNSWVEVSAEAK